MTQRCPECGLINDDNDWTCHWCGSIIQNERRVITIPEIIHIKSPFSIESFCRENFQLFTIIGVIGAMLALLPNLAEKILGIDWIESDFKILQLIFGLFIAVGGLLLFTLFYILIEKIWRENSGDKLTKQGVILFCILLLMMMGSFYFILTLVLMIPNYTITLSSIIVFFVLAIAFTIYSYYCFFADQFHIIQSLTTQRYGLLKSVFYIIFLIGLFVIASIYIVPPISNFFIHPQDPHDVVILTDQEIFSPSISEKNGIELYPTNSTNMKSIYPNYNRTGFRWETNYGYFVAQDQRTSKTILLDNYTVRHSEDKVYWSFSATDIPKDRSPIQITLKIYRADGWDWVPLMNTSMNLTWTDQNFARVEDFRNHSIGYWTLNHPFLISD